MNWTGSSYAGDGMELFVEDQIWIFWSFHCSQRRNFAADIQPKSSVKKGRRAIGPSKITGVRFVLIEPPRASLKCGQNRRSPGATPTASNKGANARNLSSPDGRMAHVSPSQYKCSSSIRLTPSRPGGRRMRGSARQYRQGAARAPVRGRRCRSRPARQHAAKRSRSAPAAGR